MELQLMSAQVIYQVLFWFLNYWDFHKEDIRFYILWIYIQLLLIDFFQESVVKHLI